MTTQLLSESIELLEGTLDAAAKTVGVVLIRPGWSQNGRYYSKIVLAKAAPLFEGVKAYANHPTREQLRRGDSRSILDITGNYTDVRVGEDGELRATRHVFGTSGDAIWPLIERSMGSASPVIGVSINALGKAGKGNAPDGKGGMIIESIDIANSADDVDRPAAGGGFTPLLMGDETLLSDLLNTLTYDEFITARPEFVTTLKKQLKRERQTEAIRAVTTERDSAHAALSEAHAQRDTAQADLDASRAKIARLRADVALEHALRTLKFEPKYEKLLREQLESIPPSEWAAELQREKARVSAMPPVRPVAVHSAPLREAQQVQSILRDGIAAPVDMTAIDTPEKLKIELARRDQMR